MTRSRSRDDVWIVEIVSAADDEAGIVSARRQSSPCAVPRTREEIGEDDDRIERRPELVRHGGQEARLRRIGRLGLGLSRIGDGGPAGDERVKVLAFGALGEQKARVADRDDGRGGEEGDERDDVGRVRVDRRGKVDERDDHIVRDDGQRDVRRLLGPQSEERVVDDGPVRPRVLEDRLQRQSGPDPPTDLARASDEQEQTGRGQIAHRLERQVEAKFERR